ncbi:MAG: DNA polymerase III subunit gamma/tau C-terminal domain-containing protein, partial [Pseudomonadota bacterium]
AAVGEPSPPEPRAAMAAVQAAPEGDPVRFDWHAFARGLPPGTARELALHSDLQACDAERVVLALAPGNRTLCTERARSRLKAALEEALGHSVHLEMVDQAESGAVTPAARLAADAAERQASAEAAMREDPVVRALGEQFGAELETVRFRGPGEAPA